MKLTQPELEFLSAWAREEWEPKCYHLPAHRLQTIHQVMGHWFFALIKMWTNTERTKGHGILDLAQNSNPAWPWKSLKELQNRVQEAAELATATDS